MSAPGTALARETGPWLGYGPSVIGLAIGLPSQQSRPKAVDP